MRVKEREYFQRRFRCRRRPQILRSLMAERREKPSNIFQKVAIRKTRCQYIWEKSTFWKLGFFFHIFSTQNHSRENSPNSTFCFVLFVHLVVKPLGMNVTIFFLMFIPKSRPCVLHTNLNNNRTPAITIIGVPFTVLTFGVFRKFKQGRFWAPHVNRKWAFFSFNMLWRYQICVAKCLNS